MGNTKISKLGEKKYSNDMRLSYFNVINISVIT